MCWFEPRKGSDWREPGHSAAAALTPSGTEGPTFGVSPGIAERLKPQCL